LHEKIIAAVKVASMLCLMLIALGVAFRSGTHSVSSSNHLLLLANPFMMVIQPRSQLPHVRVGA
jgi:hypothetical protein